MNLEISQKAALIQLHKFEMSIYQYRHYYFSFVFGQMTLVPNHVCYLCPICLSNYFLVTNGKIFYSSEFSLDHYPPENVGGKYTSVVCKKCNNSAGTEYEPEIEAYIKREVYNKRLPNTYIKSRIPYPSPRNPNKIFSQPIAWGFNEKGEWSIEFTNRSGKIISDVRPWHNDIVSKEFKIEIKDPDSKKTTKGLLKAAYLYCFETWGYEFAFSNAGELIRAVLKDEAEYPVAIPNLWFDNKTSLNSGVNIPKGMAFIQTPKDIISMYVNIPLSLEESDYECIVPIPIPIPNDNEFLELKRVQQYLKDNSSLQIFISSMPFSIDLRVNPRAYTTTWELLSKQNQ